MKNCLLHCVSTVVLASFGVLPALAQTAPNQEIEVVVVTAQHRKENLQNVPVSVQVIGGQVQFEQNVNSLEALAQTVPSVHIGVTPRQNDMYIRGTGSGNSASFDQAVGNFVDGIYHGRSRLSAASFLDLDRIEVLKGPQSTYFGNSAIAGAFNIVTMKPSKELDGSARALYSPQAGQYTVEAALGGPLSDTLSGRVAVISDSMKGWLHNANLGTGAPKIDNLAGRVTLLFKPNEGMDATLKLETSDMKNIGGLGSRVGNCPPAPPFTAAANCTSAIAQGLNNLKTDQVSRSPGEGIWMKSNEGVLTINLNRGGNIFTSTTGYYDYLFNLNLDVDALPARLFTANTPEKYHQFSQEFRIASPTNQSIEYLGGVYFQTDRLSVKADSHYFFFDPTIASRFSALIPYRPLGQLVTFNQKEDITSVFGAVSWNATDQLKITGELRGSRVKKDIDGSLVYGTATQDYGGTDASPLPASVVPVANGTGLGVVHTKNATRTDEAWMPTVKIQYKITPTSMGYASYTKGFLAGGFNGFDTSGVASRLPFGPEYVDAYEVGVKSKWDKLLLNLSLFRGNYSDLQVVSNSLTAAGTNLQVIANVAKSVAQGVEFEGQWAISSNFRLAANITYLDSHYVSYPGASPTQEQSLRGLRFQDLSGRPTQYSPRWSGSVTGTYKTPLSNGYKLTTALSPYFSSSYYLFTGTNDELHKQSAYARLDGRMTLESPNRTWAFDLIGKNLNNRAIKSLSTSLLQSPGSTQDFFHQPRSISVQARYNW